jgi:phenylacetate-coenzyme A ligase PaaK-like adenylate-forming protein
MAIEQGRYFDDSESVPSQLREEIQTRKLVDTVAYAYNNSRAAKNLLDFVGIKPSSDFNMKSL